MLLAALVVEQDALLQGFGGELAGDAAVGLSVAARLAGDLERVVGVARVAAGVGGDAVRGRLRRR